MQRSGRWMTAGLMVTMLATACAGAETGSSAPASPGAGNDDGPVLRISTTDGLVGVRATSGSVVYRAGRAVASPTGEVLYRAEPTGAGTAVVGLAGDTGQVRTRHVVAGAMDVRAVGASGRHVVLAPARPPGSDPYRPVPKERSTVTVLDTRDGSVRSVELAGNYEPEALSTDGWAVFVVEFSPPMAPDRYRVRRLDLASRTVGDVFSPDKELQQDMRGSAHRQVMARDGRRLYTLYSLVDADGARRAFVHVLDLHEQWAHCVDLPGSVGSGPDEALALALDDAGRRLFVLDGQPGMVAEVDTTALTVAAPTALPAPLRSASPLVAATEGGRLYAAKGRTVVVLDPSTGSALRRLELPQGASALDLVLGGGAGAYVSSGNALWRLGPSGDSTLRRVPLEAGTTAAAPAAAGSRSTFQCAC